MSEAVQKKIRQIVQSRAGGAVQRCHGIRHIGSYSNAEHTWGVLQLLWQLYPDHFAAIAPVALAHDIPEFIFGDVPAPTMRYVPGLREQLGEYEDALNVECGNLPESSLTGLDFRILKSCDRLEFWFWTQEQALLGNQFAHEGQFEIERYFNNDPNALEERAREVWLEARAMCLAPSQAGVAERIAKEVELKR